MAQYPNIDAYGSFELAVLDGMASEMLANTAAVVPVQYQFDPAAIYADPGPIGVYLDRYVDATPGSITLAEYPVMDDYALSDSVVGVQVTIWHEDRRALKAITSDLFDLFHGRHGGMLGAVQLVTAQRSSGTNLGQDSRQRQGRSENYYMMVNRPSPNRI